MYQDFKNKDLLGRRSQPWQGSLWGARWHPQDAGARHRAASAAGVWRPADAVGDGLGRRLGSVGMVMLFTVARFEWAAISRAHCPYGEASWDPGSGVALLMRQELNPVLSQLDTNCIYPVMLRVKMLLATGAWLNLHAPSPWVLSVVVPGQSSVNYSQIYSQLKSEDLKTAPPDDDKEIAIKKSDGQFWAEVFRFGNFSTVWLRRHPGARRGREGAPYSTLVPSDEVTISYRHGLPVITLTLPTRSERCRFPVKPMMTTVGAFLRDVQREDKGIERAEVLATDGSKVSDATLMEVLLMNDFKLVINSTAYSVSPPVKDRLSSERATEMEDIRSLVHRLFVALHLENHQIRKERELLQKLDHLKEELLPLEQMKARITDSADAKTSRLLWVGLALMSTQGGALAWLTWWVYSWDIMEPVTYFITYGSAMAFYAYFVVTKQDYIYPAAKDRQFLHYFYRKSKTHHFNVERYNKLKEDLAEAEESLRRLRQPLHLRLPIQEINDKE
ncbi:calcium uniporter regulatory subunit MCUb, mitochondrial [Pterocles gutturalis]